MVVQIPTDVLLRWLHPLFIPSSTPDELLLQRSHHAPWLQNNQPLMYALGGLSLLRMLASIFLAPRVLTRNPADYFAHAHRPHRPHRARLAKGASLHLALLIAKNLIGYDFLICGVAMLVLLRPGLITMLVGFFMIDFPGKYRAEKWLISGPRVLHAINWIRHRRARPSLILSPQNRGAGASPGTLTPASQLPPRPSP